ncbi:putative Polysaccharide biosynthesis protein [Tenacibaculum sp. 190524A02b]|uniref:Polysaccharide biosynthesis protein n=1 Tax=Tenacibaculum vairaonense TaxID=3137860 RepID=A0ABM9PJR4_9FLAO
MEYNLVFIRSWNQDSITAYSRQLAEEVLTISDFKNLGDICLYDEIYYGNYEFFVEEKIIQEIILRDRVLRMLNEKEAIRLVKNTFYAIDRVFKKHTIKNVVAQCIDNYILHILNIITKWNNIDFHGFVISFIENTYRITAMGEYNYSRKVENEEVEKVFEKFNNKIPKPFYLSRRKRKFNVKIKQVFKMMLKYFYFGFKYFSGIDKSYHSLLSFKSVVGYKLKDVYSGIESDNDWVEKIELTNKTIVFHPLQYFPEATTEYWVEDLNLIDYENKIVNCLDATGNDILWLLKEHPAQDGLRYDSKLYESVKERKNVIVIPTNVPSDKVMEMSDLILVWTGTAGFEAVFKNKPVIHFGKPYYAKEDCFTYCSNLNDLELFIQEAIKKERLTDEQKKGLIRYVLEGTLKGRFRNPIIKDGKWDDSEAYNNEGLQSFKEYVTKTASL